MLNNEINESWTIVRTKMISSAVGFLNYKYAEQMKHQPGSSQTATNKSKLTHGGDCVHLPINIKGCGFKR